MSELDLTRAKNLGTLIRDARRQAGRSLADCAQVIGVSEAEFEQAEEGEYVLSLPDVEVLAMYLQVPMAHFWGNESTSHTHRTDYSDFVFLRRRIIGALLRQARLQANRSIQELADDIGATTEWINACETGTESIPLFELEAMGKALGVTLDYFSDTLHGPLAEHEAEQKLRRRFDRLPPEVQAFVTEPINFSYLETAIRLSEMDVTRLRRIAEGILDITF
jgi:transcriptional regulator with XRE-family HTH domain